MQPTWTWSSAAPTRPRSARASVPTSPRPRSAHEHRSRSRQERAADGMMAGIVGVRFSAVQISLADADRPWFAELAALSPEKNYHARNDGIGVQGASGGWGVRGRHVVSRFVGSSRTAPPPLPPPKRGRGLPPPTLPPDAARLAPHGWRCAICLRSNWVHEQLARLPTCGHCFHVRAQTNQPADVSAGNNHRSFK